MSTGETKMLYLDKKYQQHTAKTNRNFKKSCKIVVKNHKNIVFLYAYKVDFSLTFEVVAGEGFEPTTFRL